MQSDPGYVLNRSVIDSNSLFIYYFFSLGLLLSICNKLYDGGIFSQEGFLAWEANQNPAEQEGKGKQNKKKEEK